MRRSRSALTAWPAFADLMTVLAVLGLAIAAGVASMEGPGEDRPLDDQVRHLTAELEAAQGINDRLRNELEAARERIEQLKRRVTEGVLGTYPCLGTWPGSLTAPVPLLRIVVDSGYRLTRLWPPEKEADVAAIPRLEEAVAQGLMQEGDLQDFANSMYEYGNADDNTYGRACRFWVELLRGETASQAAFSRAAGLVNQYFLFSNPGEVNQSLRRTP